MTIRTLSAAAGLAPLCLILCAEVAQSATLTLIDSKYRINGELVQDQGKVSSAGPLQPAQDAPPDLVVDAAASIENCSLPPPLGCRNPGTSDAELIYEIKPEEGEGQNALAPLCATWTASVSVEADSNAAAAAASGGGTASATASAPNTAHAATSAPASVRINSEDPISLGTIALATPSAMTDDSSATSVDVPTKIGDTLVVRLAAASAVATPSGGSAQARAQGRVAVRFGPCSGPPPTSVPSLSVWGIILTSMLLAAVGYFGIGRQAR